MEQAERRFKVGDKVVPVDPHKSRLPERPGEVTWVGFHPHNGKLMPIVLVRYDGVPALSSQKRYEWVFTKWSPTAATDPGVEEYEEIIAVQTLLEGQS